MCIFYALTVTGQALNSVLDNCLLERIPPLSPPPEYFSLSLGRLFQMLYFTESDLWVKGWEDLFDKGQIVNISSSTALLS